MSFFHNSHLKNISPHRKPGASLPQTRRSGRGGNSHPARRGKLVKANMEPYGPGHKEIVMTPGYRAERAVLTPLICKIFVKTALVALGIEPLAYDLDKRRHHHRLGGDVGMESIARRCPAHHLGLAARTRVEVVVDIAQTVEDEVRLVAVDVAVRIAGLKSVALDNKKRVAIE